MQRVKSGSTTSANSIVQMGIYSPEQAQTRLEYWRPSHSDFSKMPTLPQGDGPKEEKSYFASTLSFLTYSYRETLFAELDRLVDDNKDFDGLIIDLMQTGFFAPDGHSG